MPPQLSRIVVFFALLYTVASQQALTWTQVTPAGATISARRDAAMVYDQPRNRLVVYGGRDTTGSLSDTWEFDIASSTWTELSPATNPGRRFLGVYGVVNNKFVVATGEGTNDAGVRTFYHDAWSFDLATNQWTELVSQTSTASHPDGRYGSVGGIYDGNLVISHGFAKVRYDDTWILNLATNAYVNFPTSDPKPFGRCLGGGAIDGDQLSIFGGCGSFGWGPCPTEDTWTLSMVTGEWSEQYSCPAASRYTQLSPPNSAVAGSGVVQYGGNGQPGDGQIGIFNSATGEWSMRVPEGTPPSSRQSASLATVEGSASPVDMYVFGGTDGNLLAELWRVTGTPSLSTATGCSSRVHLEYVHGSFMFIGWGFLLPLGVLAARYGKNWKPNTPAPAFWFRIHRIMQPVGLLMSLLGLIIVIVYVAEMKAAQFGQKYTPAMAHAIMGLVIMLVGLMQPLNAFIRPHADPRTTKRAIWEFVHKNLGRAAILLSVPQIFIGLFLVQAHMSLWVLYGVWVGFMFLYSIYGEVARTRSNSKTAHEMHAVGKDNSDHSQ